MIFDLLGLRVDLVRQQPTSLGLRRDSPEDGLLGAHPVRKDPTRLAKGRTGTVTQTLNVWRIVRESREPHPSANADLLPNDDYFLTQS